MTQIKRMRTVGGSRVRWGGLDAGDTPAVTAVSGGYELALSVGYYEATGSLLRVRYDTLVTLSYT